MTYTQYKQAAKENPPPERARVKQTKKDRTEARRKMQAMLRGGDPAPYLEAARQAIAQENVAAIQLYKEVIR
jgi:hypothetical protein